MTPLLIYHFVVLILAVVSFFMKWTAPTAVFEMIINIFYKVISLYAISYAVVQLFKHFGII